MTRITSIYAGWADDRAGGLLAGAHGKSAAFAEIHPGKAHPHWPMVHLTGRIFGLS